MPQPGTKTKLEMIFDLDFWSLQILGIQHLAGRFLVGLGFPYNAFWNSPTLGADRMCEQKPESIGIFIGIYRKL
jgi:hypothetical protein